MKLMIGAKICAGFAIALLPLAIGYTVSANPKAYVEFDDVEPEMLVSKHQAAIGDAGALKKVSSVVADGLVKAVFKGRGTGETSGRVVLASAGKSNLIGMKFENAGYPHERMGFDGKDFSVAFITPGVRSPLGDFLLNNDKTFEVGILGGVLSTSWELLDYNTKRGKLSCDTSKVNDSEGYKCRYRPRKGSDLRIELFFDSSFRHVRTEYSRVIAARQGSSVDNSARQAETRYEMTETFSDFREEQGLTLPHQYMLNLEIQTGNGSWLYSWDMDLERFMFNTDIDPKEFKVDEY